MKTVLLSLAVLILAGCGRGVGTGATAITPVAAVPTTIKAACVVIDECSYQQDGFTASPIYNCVATTWQESEHPEINPADFEGTGCIITREDYHTEESMCGWGQVQFPCQIQVQGPGPEAVP